MNTFDENFLPAYFRFSNRAGQERILEIVLSMHNLICNIGTPNADDADAVTLKNPDRLQDLLGGLVLLSKALWEKRDEIAEALVQVFKTYKTSLVDLVRALVQLGGEQFSEVIEAAQAMVAEVTVSA